MKYCKELTTKHPISISYNTCIERIDSILKREGGSCSVFKDEVALNLDRAKNNSLCSEILKMKSMDFFICISDDNNVEALLIDFKLNCKSFRSLNCGDFVDKIRDSKRLLFGGGIQVSKECVFIFQDAVLEQFRRVISSRIHNPNLMILSVNGFKSRYF